MSFSGGLKVSAFIYFIIFGCGGVVAEERLFRFSLGYRTSFPVLQNIVELGEIYRCLDDSWCMRLIRFEGSRDINYVDTMYRHKMRAPYLSNSCRNKLINYPKGVGVNYYNGNLIIRSGGVKFVTQGIEYEFISEVGLGNNFRVGSLGGNEGVDQVVGFGGFSELPIKPDFSSAGRFRGEMKHKNADSTVFQPWENLHTSFDFGKFAIDSEQGILINSYPGKDSISVRAGKDVWVNGSFVFPVRLDDMDFAVHKYGHDFNANGCFDEYGHSKLLLPLFFSGGAKGFVYVEYSKEGRSGYPMISVGLYFR